MYAFHRQKAELVGEQPVGLEGFHRDRSQLFYGVQIFVL